MSSNGQIFASADADGLVKVWSMIGAPQTDLGFSRTTAVRQLPLDYAHFRDWRIEAKMRAVYQTHHLSHLSGPYVFDLGVVFHKRWKEAHIENR